MWKIDLWKCCRVAILHLENSLPLSNQPTILMDLSWPERYLIFLLQSRSPAPQVQSHSLRPCKGLKVSCCSSTRRWLVDPLERVVSGLVTGGSGPKERRRPTYSAIRVTRSVCETEMDDGVFAGHLHSSTGTLFFVLACKSHLNHTVVQSYCG